MHWPGLSPVGSRLLAAIAMAGAFLIMASIFVPHQIEARDGRWIQPQGDQWRESGSTDPHLGLSQLGTLEHACCRVRIYATDDGPRYSVYELTDDGERELGVLLSADQMEVYFPELPLRGVEFGAGRQLMLAPLRSAHGIGWDE